MKILNLPRGRGKTMRMLYASELHNAPILCSTQTSKQNIIDMSKWFSVDIPTPITVSELIQNRGIHKHYGKSIVIDDMDLVIQQLFKQQFGVDVVSATLTIQKENEDG